MNLWPELMGRDLSAKYIDGNLREIDDLRARGEITPVGDGKRIRFRKADLDAWIARQPERSP